MRKDEMNPFNIEIPCPYSGTAYSKVPGYIPGDGCPVCKGIGPNHLTIIINKITYSLKNLFKKTINEEE
jgi:hypothetical protein